MSWINEKNMGRVDLEEVAQSMFGSTARVKSSPLAIQIWLPGWTEWRIVKNHDTIVRAALWVWLVAAFPIMWWAEHKGLPDGVGFFGAGTILAALGWWMRGYLKTSFTSRVKEQLTLRCSASSTENEELATEAIIAFWAIRDTRPFFSRRTNYLLGGGSNDIYVTMLAPLHKALRLVHDKVAGASTPSGSWPQQNYYDQAVKGAVSSVEQLEQGWFRTVKIPLLLQGWMMKMCPVFFLWFTAIPFVVK